MPEILKDPKIEVTPEQAKLIGEVICHEITESGSWERAQMAMSTRQPSAARINMPRSQSGWKKAKSAMSPDSALRISLSD